MTDFRQHSIPLEILDDLGSRFIINVPEEERKDLIRICFQVKSVVNSPFSL
jgi:mRNA-decapping enzyme subunit 2